MSLWRRWIPVVLWVAVIYTAIPFVRALSSWFIERWDPIVIGWIVVATLGGGAVAAGVTFRRARTELRPGALYWLAAATLVMVLWTYDLRRSPEEAVHLIQYGVLAILVFRALRPAIPDALVFVAGALIGSLVGTLDEVIQWFVPTRFWDWRDLVLNAGAGAIVQLTLCRIVPRGRDAISPRSIRIVLRLAAAQLLLLTLCLSNTPQRVARYAPLLPGFDHLMSPENPMAEYGHLHREQGLGGFKSRLRLDELEAEDRERDSEVAAIVDGARHRYEEFLKTWPIAEDPFSYEMRVHLFARDRNLGRARESGFEGAMAVERLTIAWSENALLERFFGRSLKQSSYVWPPGLRERVASLRDLDHAFSSAAGSHLITAASEFQLRLALLTLVVAIVIADLRIRSSGGHRR